MRTSARSVALLCVAALLSIASLPARGDAIDAYIRQQMEQLRLPGVALAVVRDGRPVTIRTYGKASLELDAPVTQQTVFELGSLTKQFTAVAVLTLVDEGKLRLEDSVLAYLPELPESWRDITVRHLLTHSAGIQEYLSVPGLADAAHALDHVQMTRLFAERVRREFPAGATWAYSNTGYLLLGDLLERVSGRSYWELLRERLFVPAGMRASRGSNPRAVIRHRAAGYGWHQGEFENRGALSENAYSAGAIAATILDMVAWEAALQRRKLISETRFREMWTPLTVNTGPTPPFNYGFGWVIDQEQGHRAVLHSGGTPGFSSAIRRYVDDGLSVIVLANHGDRVLDHIPMEVAGLVYAPVARASSAADPDPEQSTRLTALLRGLLAGKADVASFTPPMQLFLTTATGKGLWEWIASHGELTSLTYVQTERTGSNTTLRYRAQMGSARLWFSFTLTPTGEIAQIYWW
jgi:CubicO group peptidase (beta-lactamase class C family)